MFADVKSSSPSKPFNSSLPSLGARTHAGQDHLLGPVQQVGSTIDSLVPLKTASMTDKIATRPGSEVLLSATGLVKSLGGTISGEHGIGLIQKEYMDIVFEEANLQMMRGIKKTFDPNNILNSGKIFDL